MRNYCRFPFCQTAPAEASAKYSELAGLVTSVNGVNKDDQNFISFDPLIYKVILQTQSEATRPSGLLLSWIEQVDKGGRILSAIEIGHKCHGLIDQVIG